MAFDMRALRVEPNQTDPNPNTEPYRWWRQRRLVNLCMICMQQQQGQQQQNTHSNNNNNYVLIRMQKKQQLLKSFAYVAVQKKKQN